MRYSYSNISTFAQCPYRWKLQYLDNLKTIPETNADNALWLGLAIHKGIEMWEVQAGLDEYKSHYNIITDENINWMIQIEYQLTKLLGIIPRGDQHEIEVKTDRFIGFIDYLVNDELWDWKFTNNIDKYLSSPQLSIYRHYLSVVRPDIEINHLKFCFIPKINIKQKRNETIFEFRQRLQEHLDASEIKTIEVPFNSDSITQFESCCQQLETVDKFPKNPTKLCSWCAYQKYCESDGKIDYMIL